MTDVATGFLNNFDAYIHFNRWTLSGDGIKFEQKAVNCELGGGIAAIIFNNAKGLISGGLADPTSATIPVFEMSQLAGQKLASSSLGEILLVKDADGYSYISGTSMAAP